MKYLSFPQGPDFIYGWPLCQLDFLAKLWMNFQKKTQIKLSLLILFNSFIKSVAGSPYFYAELPNNVKLYHRVRRGFPIQFGREVLASPEILNIPGIAII